MAATVETVWRLTDRASGTLDKITRFAERAMLAADKAANSLDKLASPVMVRKLGATERAVRKLGNEGASAATKLSGSIDKAVESIDRAAVRLTELGAMKASPKVDVDGVAEALAQIAVLKRELSSLSRQNATPGVAGAVGGAAAAAGGLASAGGGAGKGLFGSGAISGLGALSGKLALFTGLAVAASPVILTLAGAIGALVGSLVGAVGGAALIGGGLLGAFAVGIGSIFAAVKPAIGALGQYTKATDALNKAVASGDSKKIATAQQAVDKLAKDFPGIDKVAGAFKELGKQWAKLTKPAQRGFFGLAAEGIDFLRSKLPLFASEANKNFAAARKAVNIFLGGLRGKRFDNFIKALGQTFRDIMPKLGEGFRSLGSGLTRLITRSLPGVKGLAGGFANLMDRFDKWTRTKESQKFVTDMISSFKAWGKLLGGIFDVFIALFKGGGKAGNNMVTDFTKTLHKWADTIEKNPDFFKTAVEDASNLFATIGRIIDAIGQLATALLPVMRALTDAINALVDNKDTILALAAALAAFKIGKFIPGAIPGFPGKGGPGGVPRVPKGGPKGGGGAGGGAKGGPNFKGFQKDGLPGDIPGFGRNDLPGQGPKPSPKPSGGGGSFGGRFGSFGGKALGRVFAPIAGVLAGLSATNAQGGPAHTGTKVATGAAATAAYLTPVLGELLFLSSFFGDGLQNPRKFNQTVGNRKLAHGGKVGIGRHRGAPGLDPVKNNLTADMFAGLKGKSKKDLDELDKRVSQSRKHTTDQTKVAGANAKKNLTTAWSQTYKGVSGSASAMAKAVATGMSSIMSTTDKVLKQLGVKGGVGAAITGATQARGSSAGSTTPGAATGGHQPSQRGHARGGRIAGQMRGDHIALQGIADAGEMVVNRHTERRINSILSHHGTSLERETAREGRPHTAPMYATGGRVSGVYTASTFGGPGDPGTGSTGYRGDNLYQHPDSFAELNMGTALGNLPYLSPITVGLNGKAITVKKRDIGAGGPGLGGKVRAVDMWFQAAQKIGLSGLANVMVNSGAGTSVDPTMANATIRGPRMRGRNGAFKSAGNAAFGLGTTAANKLIAANSPQGMAMVGSPFPGGSAGGNNPRLHAFANFLSSKGISPSEAPWLPGGVHPVHAHYGAPDHYNGGAIDVGPPSRGDEIVTYAEQAFKAGTLAPWGPGIIWKGGKLVRNPGIPDHYDHVHISAHAKGGRVPQWFGGAARPGPGTLARIGQDSTGRERGRSPYRNVTPEMLRSSSAKVKGGGRVNIGHITIHNHADGDVRKELDSYFDELAGRLGGMPMEDSSEVMT